VEWVKDKKLVLRAIVALLVVIEITTIFLMYKSFSHRNIDKVKEVNTVDKKHFAMYVENKDTGKYEVYTGGTYYPSGYILDEEMSKCVDNNGAAVADVLSYSNGKLTVASNKTLFCDIYLQLPPPDLKVSINTVESDDATSTTVPIAYGLGYKKEVSCNNKVVTWNDKYQRLEVSSTIENSTTCTLTYSKDTSDYTKDYLTQYIIDQAVEGTSDGTGQAVGDVVHETFEDASGTMVDTGYRYEGKNPDNYVWFNNELWRIIGVFDTEIVDEDGNVTGTEKLTKIIREEPIGLINWDKSLKNNWPGSSLYKLLNSIDGDTNSGAYLNSQDGNVSGYCFGYNTIVKANCDYTGKGLDGLTSYYGSLIENVKWYLGGISSSTDAENSYRSPASTWYTYERGNLVYDETSATEVDAYIGLMYGSDYGYSVKASAKCNRSKSLHSYGSKYCASESWLYNGNEWLITPTSDEKSGAMGVYNDGWLLSRTSGTFAYAVRPVVYLNSKVYKISGTGKAVDPYTIGV